LSAFGGIWRIDGASVERRDLERMAGALPSLDGARASSWLGDGVGLVYRPFVVTPEDRLERQPWSDPSGNRRLLFDGRIDNRADLARSLDIASPELAGMADGRLCLAAFERWGVDALSHLVGAYAIALWDETDRRLVLARDKTGQRPLFYHRTDRLLVFGTGFNVVLAAPDVPRELDEVVLTDHLVQAPFEERRTVYRGIERVLSASMAICNAGGFAVRQYWAPTARSLGLATHEDYVAAARELLDTCVGSALRAEGPVAAMASGGLDSAGVAATAARLLAPTRLPVFTRLPPVTFNGGDTKFKYMSERSRVEALARLHPNFDLRLIDDADLHPIDTDPGRFFALTGVFTAAAGNVAWLAPIFDQVRGGGGRVLLTGQWGNLTLGWSGEHHIRQLFRAGRFGKGARAVADYRRATGESLLATVRSQLVSPLLPTLANLARRLRSWRERRPEFVGFVNPAFVEDNHLRERVQDLGSFQTRRLQPGPFEYRTQWLLRAGQRARDWAGQPDAFLGLELRDPLVDARLVEFCLNVPEEHFQWGGWPRALQRDVIADRTPPEIYAGLRRGAQSPEWFDRMCAQREGILDDVDRISRSPLGQKLIDIGRLRAALQDWPADGRNLGDRELEIGQGLDRTMHLARFISWFEGANQ